MPHAAKAWLHATKFTLPQKSGTMFRHCPLQFDYGQADGASGAGEGNNSKQQRRQTAKRAANSIKVPLHTLFLSPLPPRCYYLRFAPSPFALLQCGLFFERFFKRKTRMNPWHYNCISNSVSSSVSIRISFISDSRSANASIAQILLLSTSTPRSPKVVEESMQAEVKAEALTVINSGDNKNKGTHILDAPTPTYISTLAHLQTHNNKNRS